MTHPDPLADRILFEDNHLVAIDKPAGLASAHSDGTEATADVLVKRYIQSRHAKPGNVFLGVVHRIDRPTTGVLLFARTSKAASRLSEQFRLGSIRKEYWAVLEGAPADAEGSFEDWLIHPEGQPAGRVVPAGTPGAQLGRLRYRRLARVPGRTLVAVFPETGRRHQIRVQFSSRGWPVHGDAKYGSRHKLGPAIALHARTLTVEHPTLRTPLTLTANLPAPWTERFADLLAGTETPG